SSTDWGNAYAPGTDPTTATSTVISPDPTGTMSASDEATGWGLGLLLAAVLLAIYFFPTIVANSRKVEHVSGIFLLNLFLGLTLLGWVGALVWAVSDRKKGEIPTGHAPAPATLAPGVTTRLDNVKVTVLTRTWPSVGDTLSMRPEGATVAIDTATGVPI